MGKVMGNARTANHARAANHAADQAV